MWIINVIVGFEKLTEDAVEIISRAFTLTFKAGRIPSRDRIEQKAFQALRDFLGFLEDTVGDRRPYEYGEPVGVTIIAPIFVPPKLTH